MGRAASDHPGPTPTDMGRRGKVGRRDPEGLRIICRGRAVPGSRMDHGGPMITGGRTLQARSDPSGRRVGPDQPAHPMARALQPARTFAPHRGRRTSRAGGTHRRTLPDMDRARPHGNGRSRRSLRPICSGRTSRSSPAGGPSRKSSPPVERFIDSWSSHNDGMRSSSSCSTPLGFGSDHRGGGRDVDRDRGF